MRQRGDNGHVIHVSSMAGHRVPRGAHPRAAFRQPRWADDHFGE